MKYIYVYPNEKFERNVDNKTIIRAWKEGEAERYTVEDFAGLINDDDFCDMINWVRAIDDDEGYFGISKRKSSRYTLERELDNWWGELGFDEMKRVTGLDYRDFSPVDGYQEYVDISNSLWQDKSFEDKMENYNGL